MSFKRRIPFLLGSGAAYVVIAGTAVADNCALQTLQYKCVKGTETGFVTLFLALDVPIADMREDVLSEGVLIAKIILARIISPGLCPAPTCNGIGSLEDIRSCKTKKHQQWLKSAQWKVVCDEGDRLVIRVQAGDDAKSK